MIPLVNNVTFKRALETFIIKPLESNRFNPEKFIKDIYYRAFELLSKQLKAKRGMRIQFTLLADFYQSTDLEKKLSEKNFNTSCLPVVNKNDIKLSMKAYTDDLMSQIAQFEAYSSGCFIL